MDMQAKKNSVDGAEMGGGVARILLIDAARFEAWCALAGIEQWDISKERFAEGLARCAEARFRGEKPSVEELKDYVGALRLKDLGLAFACADGVAVAWEHFVGIYRGYLRACAAAILKRNASALEVQELADSLFGEL